MAESSVSQTRLYEWLTGDDDSRMCDDIPESACDEQPRNFFFMYGPLWAISWLTNCRARVWFYPG
ncbi:hypothetical protein HORIV_45280 [Vreelandella olivaria]|uniref:Uncharacterized protein n=1 Tax=Vreelandella olivaria TaxID=390919 RepID=A0ABM7GMY4_9GAMM|nr:hypothetical protein HORIV_45280 [Halomonas olivaria]